MKEMSFKSGMKGRGSDSLDTVQAIPIHAYNETFSAVNAVNLMKEVLQWNCTDVRLQQTHRASWQCSTNASSCRVNTVTVQHPWSFSRRHNCTINSTPSEAPIVYNAAAAAVTARLHQLYAALYGHPGSTDMAPIILLSARL